MDPSSAQQHHHQEMASQTLENMLVCTKPQQEKKPRPPEQALKCPRCDSTNTKFCYYNNYSLSQPRYFCKSCRRYWTKGGTLRNVPVGGGCRKNKRSSSSKRNQDQTLGTPNPNNPLSNLTPPSYDSPGDLSLAFARLHQRQTSGQLGFDDHHDHISLLGDPSNTHCEVLGNTCASTPNGFLDALRCGFLDTTHNGFHNFYYGVGDGDMRDMENNAGVREEMAITMPYEDMGGATTTATTVTTVKQELCNNGRGGDNNNNINNNNRVLWGFPWQFGGDGSMGGHELIDPSSGRQSWNGFGSSWHGLLNSPLM